MGVNIQEPSPQRSLFGQLRSPQKLAVRPFQGCEIVLWYAHENWSLPPRTTQRNTARNAHACIALSRTHSGTGWACSVRPLLGVLSTAPPATALKTQNQKAKDFWRENHGTGEGTMPPSWPRPALSGPTRPSQPGCAPASLLPVLLALQQTNRKVCPSRRLRLFIIQRPRARGPTFQPHAKRFHPPPPPPQGRFPSPKDKTKPHQKGEKHGDRVTCAPVFHRSAFFFLSAVASLTCTRRTRSCT